MKETILIVDDEREIVKLIEIYLQNEGYTLFSASDGEEALSILEAHQIDLIILDIMMPRLNGIEACMRIRETRDIPIIMLSAKSEDMDKIEGLSIGADDYVAKPFNPLELVARAKSQLRRYQRFGKYIPANQDEITIDGLTINTAKHRVTMNDREVKLTPREFELLKLLALHRGVVLGMETIYEEVWKEPYMQSKNTVMVHIRRLREKLEQDPQHPRYIKTVWGIGYKLEAN
ncbi:response regulator transcription factor [Paenibacillus senegalimassiliensis]|uniref:response regulator transcription factor n=1 Tax=Paenibacillus senegalimassiliensis TaxID=1737426 RepID=UPI00073EB1F2|nr:response regulator transcription factor [Paenibacillus senegalimassiliensis]